MLRTAIAFGIAWGMLSGVAFAEADWLDRFSGPGPYWGLWLDYRFVCFSSPVVAGTKETVATFLKPWDRTATWGLIKRPLPAVNPERNNPENRKAAGAYDCKSDRLHDSLIFSIRWDQSYSNEVVPKNDAGKEARVRITGLEMGHVRRLKHGWSLRNTVAVNRFSGKQFGTFYEGSQFTGFEFSPLAAVEDTATNHWFKFIMGVTIVYADFESSAFCNRTATNPQCARVVPKHYGPELVPRIGWVINPSLR